MSKQQCVRYTITVRGETESDLEQALDEAVRLIREGNTSGFNCNDTGAFYFDSTDDLPKKEWPA